MTIPLPEEDTVLEAVALIVIYPEGFLKTADLYSQIIICHIKAPPRIVFEDV